MFIDKSYDFEKIKTSKEIEYLLEKDGNFIIEYCNRIQILAKKVIEPNEDKRRLLDRNSATVAGLYVKIYKCYLIMCESIRLNRQEPISWNLRILYESFVKMKYLIKKGENSQRNYRLVAYENRYKYYLENENITAEDPLHSYIQLRNEKFFELLKYDGFEINDLNQFYVKKNWKLDGKTFRDLIKETEADSLYTSLYGIQSDQIHSNWKEISQYNLLDGGHNMVANLDFYPIHFKCIISICGIMLNAIDSYIQWIENIFELKEGEINPVFKAVNNDLYRIFELAANYTLNIYNSDKERFYYE